MAQEISDADIKQYLDVRDDFDLELFAHRTLRERGWSVSLAGSYFDPILGKPRQFDVRAQREFHVHCHMNLAVECKSLTTEFPLVISRVLQPEDETRHDVIRRFLRPEQGDSAFFVERSGTNHYRLYAPRDHVGKSATQIRWADGGKKLVASDAETYDKWAQALASASRMADEAASKTAAKHPIFEAVLPVLLINDKTLWIVDYTEAGERGTPTPAEEATLFVDRKHEIRGRYGVQTFHLSHLHIYTRTGFLQMLKLFDGNGSLHERIFGFAIKRAAEKGLL